jgi:DNA-binding PadR family transcriptional regulator
MTSPKLGRPPKDPLRELALDASWIRVYVLWRAALEPISAADIIAALARRSFACERTFLTGILRALERKGYLARIATPNGRRPDSLYVLTTEGRCATRGLDIKIREMFADLNASANSGVWPRG